MSFLGAAIQVLGSERRPMSCKEITDSALQQGLIHPRGKTPVATMAASLYIAVRDDPLCLVERTYKPGQQRAVRGSVRWQLKN